MHYLTLFQWILVLIAGLLVGLNKAGVSGLDVILVTILIFVFGAKASTGILMPLLLVGDVLAVYHYHRYAHWGHVVKLLPWMVLGVLAGVYFGKDLPEQSFRQWLSGIVLATAIFMFWWNSKKSVSVPKNKAFAISMGFTAGFTTMVGNVAGAFSNIYLLANRLPRDQFIGTASWLFFIINFIKLPFHIWVWHTITADTLMLDAKIVPVILIGFAIGIKLIKRTSDKLFRQLVLGMTAVGAVVLLFR